MLPSDRGCWGIADAEVEDVGIAQTDITNVA
jgi:hypothetical protein